MNGKLVEIVKDQRQRAQLRGGGNRNHFQHPIQRRVVCADGVVNGTLKNHDAQHRKERQLEPHVEQQTRRPNQQRERRSEQQIQRRRVTVVVHAHDVHGQHRAGAHHAAAEPREHREEPDERKHQRFFQNVRNETEQPELQNGVEEHEDQPHVHARHRQNVHHAGCGVRVLQLKIHRVAVPHQQRRGHRRFLARDIRVDDSKDAAAEPERERKHVVAFRVRQQRPLRVVQKARAVDLFVVEDEAVIDGVRVGVGLRFLQRVPDQQHVAVRQRAAAVRLPHV